jgi:hypothetical protein
MPLGEAGLGRDSGTFDELVGERGSTEGIPGRRDISVRANF